jgi:hypothetical protein
MAGIMGFKRDFHQVSVAMGSRLMERIRAIHPERLATDCLSCRLQFNHLVPYKVFHPIEILEGSIHQLQKRLSTHDSRTRKELNRASSANGMQESMGLSFPHSDRGIRSA